MGNNKENYDGDYKVSLSDKGRIHFNLNWKWTVGFLVASLGFVGYLLLDKYYIVPMDKLNEDKIELQAKVKSLEDNNSQIISNQKILLDRSDRMEKWMQSWFESHPMNDNGNNNESPTFTIPNSIPGNSNTPST